MPVTITHTKVATVPDDPNYEVGTDEWNDEHVIALDVGVIATVVYSGEEPAEPALGMIWVTGGDVYLRNATDDGWIVVLS